MKALTLSILCALYTFFSFGQGTDVSSATILSSASVLSSYSQYVLVKNSSLDKVAYANMFKESDEQKCRRARKKETAGIVLASVGGAFIIAGGALTAIAVHQINNANAYVSNPYGTGYYTGPDGTGAIGGAVLCFVAGAGLAGPGIPLAIIGSVRANKYCGEETVMDRSYLRLSATGNSLVLNF